ncbi:MAG TPA: bifunctional glutamate N-acetyltransferase/amino-acid acetyltransferase ArgJ [Candidatus Acidoferrum sp.]|nr:bifunctional glutamate N-acetyltransferase/amino-acid acetyltransferase ArgJ [Candidatus Acidoferrum sp.]
MAVGSGELGALHPVAGVRMAAVSAGIKKPGRLDVVAFELAAGSVTGGVFTTNAFCAAPVTICQRHIAQAAPRYLLINTGNANAGTGDSGMQAAQQCCDALAKAAGVASAEVLPFSTGVIGELLPVAKIVAVVPQALKELVTDDWAKVARGIMTTDTRPKAASRQLQLNGKTVTITGIAKGAGMIKPNMATMLGYIFTDLGMQAATVQAQVKAAADKSFNRITIDGDTSTNDCCMLVATGKSGVQFASLSATEQQRFVETLQSVFIDLATAIVRDGEGATKFVTIRVEGGANVQECLQVGYAIGESPLVKTALFASDPNWGRILAAVGRAGLQQLQLDQVEIWLDDVNIVRNGARAASYTEAAGQGVLSKAEFTIGVKLGRGGCSETLWTCDFSHDYVTINAEYRT